MNHDTQLQQAVLAELSWEPSISAGHIGVTAENGIVSLSGHVESFWQKQAAEGAVRRVKGVKGIAEAIDVRLPLRVKRGDDEIAAAAAGRLAWNSSMPTDAVKVKVEKGRVTLTGQVDWHYQSEAAANDVRSLHGVVGVSNQITLKPRVDTTKLTENIRTALHRSWFFDPETISVHADGGKVRLTGTADSWYERDVAGLTAWAAPGATSVVNDISIN
jgi:osmotically-inducible protein OsmY